MARTWNKVVFERFLPEVVAEGYQEVVDGRVERYVDAKGEEMFVDPPTDLGCRVVEENARPTTSMASAGQARDTEQQAAMVASRDLSTKNNAIKELIELVRTKQGAQQDPALDARLQELQRLADA